MSLTELSKQELELIKTALERVQEFNEEDYKLDKSSRRAQGTDQWCKRMFAAQDLIKRLDTFLTTS